MIDYGRLCKKEIESYIDDLYSPLEDKIRNYWMKKKDS